MKIVITGGGTGGHFYPAIAVVDKIRELSEEYKMFQPKIFYLADKPYDETVLFRNDIEFVKITAGKLRKGFSPKNIVDIFKTIAGVFSTFFVMFKIMPDVVFTNGGYVAFPVLVSARLLRIPVILHVSDTVPSRVLLSAKSFAKYISIAFSDAAKYFDKNKTALLGNPIRDEIKKKQVEGAHSFLNLDKTTPVIWISGGSQGSEAINEIILEALPELVKKYQIVHQTGKRQFDEIYGRSGIILMNDKNKHRYKVYPYLNNVSIKMIAGAADLVVARAGAGTISEIANWGIPSILIPISKKVSRDQESNAFAYARSGAAVVIRQSNLSDHILLSEIERILSNPELKQKMSKAAQEFFEPDGDIEIAKTILNIMVKHEISL